MNLAWFDSNESNLGQLESKSKSNESRGVVLENRIIEVIHYGHAVSPSLPLSLSSHTAFCSASLFLSSPSHMRSSSASLHPFLSPSLSVHFSPPHHARAPRWHRYWHVASLAAGKAVRKCRLGAIILRRGRFLDHRGPRALSVSSRRQGVRYSSVTGSWLLELSERRTWWTSSASSGCPNCQGESAIFPRYTDFWEADRTINREMGNIYI